MNEYVSMQHINRKIQECTSVEKVIAFVDCCQPEIIKVKEEQRLIQFNATASTDTAESLRNEGSPFTKLLLQAFTMKASGGKCALPHCECRIDGPFVTIDSLSHYIEIHRQSGLLHGMEPEKSLIKINWENECLAYNNSYKVEFRFDIVLPSPFTSEHTYTYKVLATTVNDYDFLIQKILFPRFADLLGEQLNVHQQSMSHANKIADCLCIVYDTGAKCCEEVDNIEKLVLAWNSKRLLCCKLRFSLTGNCHKPSGFFLKNGKSVKDYMHEKKEFELTEMESFIKDLQDKRNKCDTDTEQALTVFISNMSLFIHGCTWNKPKHQRIQIRFIDLFDECTSCVVQLLLVNPVDMNGMDKCSEHGKGFEFYCEDHFKLCCTTCRIAHEKCDKLDDIASISRQKRAQLHGLKQSLLKLKSDADAIVAECKHPEEELNASVEDVSKDVNEMTDRMIKLFDDAKQELLTEAKVLKSEEVKRLSILQSVSTKIMEEINQLFPMWSSIADLGTPQQMFILSKQVEEKNKNIESIKEQRITQVSSKVALSYTRKLSSILEMGKQFMKVNLERKGNPSFISSLSQSRPVTLELIVSLNLTKSEDNKHEPLISGLDFLSDGRLVAVDNKNMKCMILNEGLRRLGTPYTFESPPLDVAVVSNIEIVVTCFECLLFLSVSSDNVISLTRQIKTSSSFWSICLKTPTQMVVSTSDDIRNVRMISVDGVETDFQHVEFPKKTYTLGEIFSTYVQSKNTLVLTDTLAHTVYVFDTVKGTSRAVTNGNIQQPRGACVGPGDTVMVCSEKMHVVHLTVDGDFLCTYPVDMKFPYRICVSRDGTRLAVSNCTVDNRKLQLYKILPTLNN
ncbi:uncharacterized protein LOC127833523 isoform X4 [Dreissena polymorpha]|nr:uncharacterized protein LOC127833523 isoform X4 [Dreissena polymorpha]